MSIFRQGRDRTTPNLVGMKADRFWDVTIQK
jgi:hypothetical protein